MTERVRLNTGREIPRLGLGVFQAARAEKIEVPKKDIDRTLEAGDGLLNDRSAQLVGKVVAVVSAIDEHGGRVRVGDSEWNARGGPAAPGDRVRITGVDGNCLKVETERTLPSA